MTVYLGVTGHRTILEKDSVQQNLVKTLSAYDPGTTIVLSGIALGFDQLVCEECLTLGIPYIAVVPFKGQESVWPSEMQDHYKDLISKAQSTVVVSDGGYAAWKMHKRNKYIVDNSTEMLAYLRQDHGGTWECCKLAKKSNRKLVII